MLAGRDRERAAIAALLEAARTGTGGALVLRGVAGSGKSTLLADWVGAPGWFATDGRYALLFRLKDGKVSAIEAGTATTLQFTFTDKPVLDPANWTFWWPALIVLFAVFWVLQTVELWNEGLRRRPPLPSRTGSSG